jgi:hypothetical protein
VDVLLEPDPFANLDQVVFSDSPIFRVMEQEVSQLPTLLDQIYAAEPVNFLTKIVSTEQFAQHQTGIVEA